MFQNAGLGCQHPQDPGNDLDKADVDVGKKEFSSVLTFVAVLESDIYVTCFLCLHFHSSVWLL